MGKYSIDAISAFEKLRPCKEFASIPDARLRSLLEQIAEANESYTASLGEEAYFDDDEAFDTICDKVCGNDEALDVAELVNAYMDLNDEYLESLGLVEWE